MLAAALVAFAAAALPAVAQAKFIGGLIPDGPAGANPHTVGLPAQSADLPYGGGRVLHSNRTHPIFWEPAGSGLTFDPGYESLIDTFLTDVAADSHKTTNTFSLTGQYHDSKGPAAYDSTYGGAIVDTDPLPPSGCTEPGRTGPGWSVCLTDDQLETEIEHVVSADAPADDRRQRLLHDYAQRLWQLHGRRVRRAVRSGVAPTATAVITQRPRTGSCTRSSRTTPSFRTAGRTTRGRMGARPIQRCRRSATS